MFGPDDVKKVLGGAKSAGKPTPAVNPPEPLTIAAGALLAAMGQDYGMAPDSQESRKAEFWDKARRVAAALQDFCEIASSGGGDTDDTDTE